MNRGMLAGGVIALVVIVAGAVLWTTRTPPPSSSAASDAATPPSPVPTSPASPVTPSAPAPASTDQTSTSAPAATAPAPVTPTTPVAATAAPTDAAPAAQQAAGPPQSAAGPPIKSDDRILGKPDAPITIVEFASLTCPHCADFEANTLPKLKSEWIDTGKARLVFRDFPLDQAAVRAAMLARCAPPEQFYAFIAELFHSQVNWGTGGKVETALGKIAKLSGMSDDQFAACMKDESLQKRVLDSRLEAEQQYKIESTPTFFINGVQVVGAQPYGEFERVLNKAASQP